MAAIAGAIALASVVQGRSAAAEPDASHGVGGVIDDPGARADAAGEMADIAALRRLARPAGRYVRLLATAAVGEGIRFNNPYRLRTQLAETAESLSLTAPYADVGVAATFGAPNGVQQGLALRLSTALSGISQQVLTPSWLVAHRGEGRLLTYGRIGSPVVLGPNVTFGAEAAAGLAWFVTARIGLSAELVGSLFYGAGTREVRYGVYPILAGQLGVVLEHEVLP